MAGTGNAAEGWAAKLKASLGAAPPRPGLKAPAEPARPAPPAATPEPGQMVPDLAPAADVPADNMSMTDLLLALAAPPAAEPVTEAQPEPAPEPSATRDAAVLPAAVGSLLDAIIPPPPAETPPATGPLPRSPLLEVIAREEPEPASPPAEAGRTTSASPLLDLLRPAADEPATPSSPVIEALSKAPSRSAKPRPPLPPSPLLEALRTTPPEPMPAAVPVPAPTPEPTPEPAAEETPAPPIPVRPTMPEPAAADAATPPPPSPIAPMAPEPAIAEEPAPAPPSLAVPQKPEPELKETPAPKPAPSPPPAPTQATPQPVRQPLPEREVRAVFEVLVGRAPEEAEMVPMRTFTRRTALRGFIMAGTAFREAVLAPAIAAALPLQSNGLVAGDLDVLEALGAGVPGEPGMVVDWFGLRTPVAIVPELTEHAGSVLPRPAPSDPRAPAAEWIGLAASVAGATGTWRGLSVGAGRGDLVLAGTVAARRRGLVPEPHASEDSPKAFAALLQHAEANEVTPAPGHFQQARIGTNPEAAPPRSATVQMLLEGAETWDWVRIAGRGAVGPLLRHSLPLLTERVRVLSLVTHSRREEAQAIAALARGGWRLLAELPVTLRRRSPEDAERNGVQVWRSNLV